MTGTVDTMLDEAESLTLIKHNAACEENRGVLLASEIKETIMGHHADGHMTCMKLMPIATSLTLGRKFIKRMTSK
jgi:hypothetical protein